MSSVVLTSFNIANGNTREVNRDTLSGGCSICYLFAEKNCCTDIVNLRHPVISSTLKSTFPPL